MTDQEHATERHIRKAGEASRAGNGHLWVAALYSADVVGKYSKHGTRAIADETGRSISSVENWAHAVILYRWLRKFGLACDVRKLRRALTITHFSRMWELQRKYSISPQACVWYMSQMLVYREQGKSWSADALAQEVESAENKSGSVQTWESVKESLYRTLLRISTVDMPEDVRSFVFGLISRLETK